LRLQFSLAKVVRAKSFLSTVIPSSLVPHSAANS